MLEILTRLSAPDEEQLMKKPQKSTAVVWSVAPSAAMVGRDSARRAAHTVEGPTLYDREIGFGRGIASADRSPTCNCRSSRACVSLIGPSRMRRFVSTFIALAAAALVVSGCGGGDAAGTTPTTTPPSATSDTTGTTVANDPNANGGVTSSSAGTNSDVPGVNEIANAKAASGQKIQLSARTPKKFSGAHCAQPIMVVLYQPDSILDAELYSAARTAARRSGVKDLVTIVYSPRDVKKMGDLPAKLGLLATPGIATVARDGTIENFWTSYVDDALIRRSIENAAASRPCKVASADVPAAGSALSDAVTVANGGTVVDTVADPLAGKPPGTPAVDAAAASTPSY